MKKRVLLLLLLVSAISFAQRSNAPKIGVVDMEFILENIPEYREAQAKLTLKANAWQEEIEKMEKEVVVLQKKLGNERILLTNELINEKEDFIKLKEIDVKNLQNRYFGTKGAYYKLRQVLVKPIQDEVYNSVQEIARKRKYDMVLDKSSELLFLYVDNKYDISELVLKTIEKTKKIRKEKASDRTEDDRADKLVPTQKEEEVNTIKEEKRKVQESRFKQTQEEKEARKKLIEERRKARKKKMEERKKAIRNKRLERLEKMKKQREEKNKK
ncbi:MAG: OmpH family outer membrane protein [Flavobacteriaceae bacterium]|nr:OmpH family outer membrane protein [Flavobacteriaceae bacterium]